MEIVDSSGNKTIRYDLVEFSGKAAEKDTLVTILKEYGWRYKVTTDNQVLISSSALQDLDNLYFLNVELKRRMSR